MKLIGIATDQKLTGEDGSHCFGRRTAMWKEKPPHNDLKAAT